MNELSLSYYSSICKGDAELLKTFKHLLLEDFKMMESRFFSAVQQNDVPAMRAELHKLYPIASNLKFSKMLDLIEKYRNSDIAEFPALNHEMRTYFAMVNDLLKAD